MTSDAPAVVVVDDAADVRALVRTHLRVSGRFTVVGEGATGLEAVRLASELRPDVMLLDISMPEMDGLEALPQILQASPATRVVMFTGFDERGLADRAEALGAAALLEKSVSVESLADDLVAILDRPSAPAVPVADMPPEAAPETSRLEPQRVLTEHLERFREVFEEAAIGMATMTLTGRLVRANRVLAALVGTTPGELVGASYAALTSKLDDDALAAAIAELTDGGRDVVQLEHGLHVDPDRRILTTIAPVRDAEGRALYLFLQAQDRTMQRAAEEALRQSEERFRLLVEAVSDYAIFMLDTGGHIVSWNAGAQRLNGYAADEIVGKHFRAFYPYEKQIERHPEHELELAIRDGRYEEEGWRVRKDGSLFWANVLISAVYDGAGHHVGFTKVTRDVTERRRLMEEQLESAAQLESANRDLGAANERLARAADDQAQFLAVTAHELRTPIGVISGSTELLHAHWNELDDTERVELFNSMASNASRLRRLLEDLLTAARLEAGAVELRIEDVPVSALLGNSAVAARRQYGDVDVRVDAPQNLNVRGDAGRMAQVFDNLINNAINHGQPPVFMTAEQRGDLVQIRVSDSGPGVHPDIEPRLFDRFATAKQRGGTGLGLFIVMELARAQGGDAWYEPARVAGRPTFVVTLPLAVPGDVPRESAAARLS